MGRRYYCDYCDKLFIDDIDARKKHLTSGHHLKLRKLHYDAYRDLSEILAEESVKSPCRRFHASGFCQFESACKYTHYTQEQLYEIKQLIVYEQQKRLHKQYALDPTKVPMPLDWLNKYTEWLNKYTQKKHQVQENVCKTSWSYPEHLENRSDLPPSMKKFQPELFTNSEVNEWGKNFK